MRHRGGGKAVLEVCRSEARPQLYHRRGQDIHVEFFVFIYHGTHVHPFPVVMVCGHVYGTGADGFVHLYATYTSRLLYAIFLLDLCVQIDISLMLQCHGYRILLSIGIHPLPFVFASYY